MRIDEEKIERYVRFSHTLTGEERTEVEAFLRENELARRVAEFYQDYYSELDAQEEYESAAVKSFVDELLGVIQAESADEYGGTEGDAELG